MKTIKWGIIGTGIIASAFAEALNSLDNTELAGVASRDLTRARGFADRFHIRNAYASYEELARDPEIDVVYIATPHTEHKDNAALCIKNGKAVLCEKPITINQKETQHIIDLAKEYNVFLMEAMWTKLTLGIDQSMILTIAFLIRSLLGALYWMLVFIRSHIQFI